MTFNPNVSIILLVVEICRKESARDSILDAGYDALGKVGFNKMSVESVAKAAGVSRAAVYLHFANKTELALAIIDRKNDQLYWELKAIARGKGTPTDRVRKFLNARVMIRLERVRNHAACLDELMAAVRQQLLARREKYSAREAGILAEILVEGRLKGLFEFDDAHETATAFLVATNSLLPHSLSTKELELYGQAEGIVDSIAEMAIRSILKDRPPIQYRS